MGLVHGFKSEAERLAARVRREAGFTTEEPLDPWNLARSLGFHVATLDELNDPAGEAAREYFRRVAPEDFSAMTMASSTTTLIMLNSAHSRERQASSLAHELSHRLLKHPLQPAFAASGCRTCDSRQEDEASWLGGVLLVPRDAALLLVREGISVDIAAERFGVSVQLMRMRLNASGARAQVERERSKTR
jgi:Zn-dependent peptidase ImmA (M78 family)